MQNSKITFGQYLMKVNKYSKEKAAETNKDRTYIRLFRPYNTNKLNIIGSFEEAIKKEKNKCNHFNPNSKKSFGIISKEQFSDYCFLYSKNRYIYQDEKTFQKYINQNYKNFVIDDEELILAIKKIKELKDKKLNILISKKETKKIKEIIQKSLYARCLLSVFYECAITIHGNNTILQDINNIIQTNKNIIVTLKNNTLTIKGTLDNTTLKEIDKKYVFVKEKNNNLTVYNKTNNNQTYNKLSHFYSSNLKFKVNNTNTKTKLITILKNNHINYTIKNKDILVTSILSLEPCNEIDDLLNNLKDTILIEQTLSSKTTQDTVGYKSKQSLKDYYKDYIENYKVYKSNAGALYSGVIPRLTKMTYSEPTLDNATLEGIYLSLGRTSYFTMYSMGKDRWSKHPYSKLQVDNITTYKDILEALDRYEVIIQDEYYQEIKNLDKTYENTSIDFSKKFTKDSEILNKYLSYSLAQHNMNISGNLITKDEICLYTIRNENIQDPGSYYCSVNGGCEIYDDDVSFYDNSVGEDIPTIEYSLEKVRFNNELTREAIAELGIIDDSSVWDFYGLTIMGEKENLKDKNNEKKYSRTSFHFNVIGERKCMDEFNSIIEQKIKATENFESKALYGYHIDYFESEQKRTYKYLINTIIPTLQRFEGIIIWAIILFLSFLNLASVNKENNIKTTLSTIFTVISIIALLFKTIEKIKTPNYKRKVDVVVNDETVLNVDKICERICKKIGIKDSINMDNELRILTLMRLSIYFINKENK